MKNSLLNILLDVPAQESIFRESGKIYVVVGIIVIIFICIVAYLIKLDKKITHLEKNSD
ncbi:MAG: CcmD family protein [Bacteroidota bacterium]